MPRPVTVHLLRHGEVHNPGKILYGRLPGFRLSELGRRQAQAAADWFAGRNVACLLVSPLQRAQETAAPLAAVTGLEIVTDERLIEAGNVFEGRRVDAWTFARPAAWRHLVNPRRPSWGEPYREIADRVLAAARTARDFAVLGGGSEAVCVSHQLPIVSASRRADGLRLAHSPGNRRCGLASVTSLVFDGDVVVETAYSEPAAQLPAGHGTGA